MNTFGERLKSIPSPAWVVGFVLAVPVTLGLALGPMRLEPEMRSWPTIAKAGMLALPATFLFTYSLLVGFIYADAKRRRMRHVMWAWLAVVPYFVGVILYFILRDPLPTPCPRCRTDVPQAFAFCPGCGMSVHPTCAQCGKSLQPEWMNCPHCGSRILPSSVDQVRQQSAPVAIP
jgi:hypothetical protein